MRVTLAKSPAGSLFPASGSQLISPSSIGSHLPFPTALIIVSSDPQSIINKVGLNSLVKDIPSGILVVLTPLDNLPPDIPDGDPGMIIHFRPSIIRSIVLPIAPAREGVKLSEDSSTFMEILSKPIGFLHRSVGGRDGSDKGDRLRVDGEIVVQGIVEQGE